MVTHNGADQAPVTGEPTMSDKSPKKSSSKTAASKTLKEKRADKKTKADARTSSGDITTATHKR
jgi:hypothetical protein